MKIVLASHNKKKLAELQTLLEQACPGQFQLLLPEDVGVTQEPEENGSTFLENAEIKARAIAACGYVAVADDSGLCVDALGGAPGVYSARFSGGNDRDNIELLLKKLDGKEMSERTARFVCCMVCAVPDSDRILAVQESCEGRIADHTEGEGGFGYDPIFFSTDLGKSFGVASSQEKNTVSHRAKAVARFAAELPGFLSRQTDGDKA